MLNYSVKIENILILALDVFSTLKKKYFSEKQIIPYIFRVICLFFRVPPRKDPNK